MASNGKSSFYSNPVKIKTGVGKYLGFLQEIIRNGYNNIGLFYGQSAMSNLGVIDDIRKTLKDYNVQDHGSITPNPDVTDINQFLRDRNDRYDI